MIMKVLISCKWLLNHGKLAYTCTWYDYIVRHDVGAVYICNAFVCGSCVVCYSITFLISVMMLTLELTYYYFAMKAICLQAPVNK